MNHIFNLTVEDRSAGRHMREPVNISFFFSGNKSAEDLLQDIRDVSLEWLRLPQSQPTIEYLCDEFDYNDLLAYIQDIPQEIWEKHGLRPLLNTNDVSAVVPSYECILYPLATNASVHQAVVEFLNYESNAGEFRKPTDGDLDAIVKLCMSAEENEIWEACKKVLQ